MNITKSINRQVFLILVLFSITIPSFGQISDAKDKIYNLKVNKSPAKDYILETDKIIEDFVPLNYSVEHFVSTNQGKSIVKQYNKVLENKNKILELDPKWKMNRIDDFLSEAQPLYEGIQVHFEGEAKLNNQIDELSAFFTTKEGEYRSKSTAGGEEFYNYIKGTGDITFNLNEVTEKVAQANQLIAENEDAEISGLRYFIISENKLNTTYEQRALSYIDYIEEKYLLSSLNELSGNKLVERYAEVKSALWTIKAYLLLFPDHQDLLTWKTDLEGAIAKLDKAVSEIAVSDFHKDHFNQILLSNNHITFGQESANDFKTSFSKNESIYVTIYLTFAPTNRDFNNALLLYFGNDLVAKSTVRPKGFLDNEGEALAVLHFPLVPSKDDNSIQPVEMMMAHNFLRGLKNNNGEYSLIFDAYGDDPRVDFTVDMDPDFMEENYAKASKAKKKYIGMPKSNMSDGSVPGLIKSALKMEELNDEVLKVIIISDEWIHEVHSITNETLNRTLGEVAVLCKDDNGNCYFLFCSLFQSRVDGKYQDPVIDNLYSDYGFQDRINLPDDEDYKYYVNCP